jgi:hypothetical protein
MATVTKNRTYGKIAGFWVITQNRYKMGNGIYLKLG